MASSGINNGTIISLYVGGVAIAYCTAHKKSLAMALRDASNKGSGGYKESLPGQRSWSIDAEGFFAENASYGYTDLFALYANRTSVAISWSSGVTGDKKYSGTVHMTKLDDDAKNEDSQTFSVTFEGTGALTQATI